MASVIKFAKDSLCKKTSYWTDDRKTSLHSQLETATAGTIRPSKMRRKATTLPMKSLDLASLVPQQASDHYDQRQCHIDLIRTCR